MVGRAPLLKIVEISKTAGDQMVKSPYRSVRGRLSKALGIFLGRHEYDSSSSRGGTNQDLATTILIYEAKEISTEERSGMTFRDAPLAGLRVTDASRNRDITTRTRGPGRAHGELWCRVTVDCYSNSRGCDRPNDRNVLQWKKLSVEPLWLKRFIKG